MTAVNEKLLRAGMKGALGYIAQEPAAFEEESSSAEEVSARPAPGELDIRALLGIGGIRDDDGQTYDSTYDKALIIFDENTDVTQLFYPNALEEYERRFLSGEGVPYSFQAFSSKFQYTDDLHRRLGQ